MLKKFDFVKEKWDKSDIKELNSFLYENRNESKIDFSKRVVNTNMKVLGINNPTCKDFAKEIHKGNFKEFLDKNDFKYYENTLISGYLINYIKDISEKEKFINGLFKDNWATVDILKFDIKKQEEKYLNLSKKYIKDKDTFTRRVGVRILFSFTDSEYVDEVYKIIDTLYNEKEYYVNMAVAWLICELMIKNKEKTIKYLSNGKINDFTLKKAISKCKDSFRVSKEDVNRMIECIK